jgi:hypothetical protein
MVYATDGKLGVDFTGTTAVTADATFEIGVQVPASDGADYVYTRAASTVAAGDVVSILVDGTVAPLTTVNASVGSAIGFAQTAIASASFGFVALRGPNLQVNVLANCAPEVMLFTTATAGHLDDTTVTLGLVEGVMTQAAATSNATAHTAICAYPHISRHLMA